MQNAARILLPETLGGKKIKELISLYITPVNSSNSVSSDRDFHLLSPGNPLLTLRSSDRRRHIRTSTHVLLARRPQTTP
jgi:hypothetical protein